MALGVQKKAMNRSFSLHFIIRLWYSNKIECVPHINYRIACDDEILALSTIKFYYFDFYTLLPNFFGSFDLFLLLRNGCSVKNSKCSTLFHWSNGFSWFVSIFPHSYRFFFYCFISLAFYFRSSSLSYQQAQCFYVPFRFRRRVRWCVS